MIKLLTRRINKEHGSDNSAEGFAPNKEFTISSSKSPGQKRLGRIDTLGLTPEAVAKMLQSQARRRGRVVRTAKRRGLPTKP